MVGAGLCAWAATRLPPFLLAVFDVPLHPILFPLLLYFTVVYIQCIYGDTNIFKAVEPLMHSVFMVYHFTTHIYSSSNTETSSKDAKLIQSTQIHCVTILKGIK